MKWRKATFKGKDVWVEVDATGEPSVQGGRVAMRYSSKANTRIYRAGIANVTLGEGIEDLPDGVSADAKPTKKKSKGSGFGKAGTRSAAQAAQARQHAANVLAELGDHVVVAFTDGGCSGNPGPAGSGVYLKLPDGRTAEVSRSLGRATNNVAELTAIDIALDLLDEAELPLDAEVVLLSDSDYANGVLTRGWKPKKNVDLIAGLKDKLSRRSGVRITWVAGHAGIEGNERADRLATAGVAGTSRAIWTPAP